VRRDDLVVSALLAVNAVGDIDPDGRGLDRAMDLPWPSAPPSFANTTIGVIATNAALTKSDALLVAQGGHDGLARCLVPSHTRVDGDAIITAATGPVAAQVDLVRLLGATAVERAVRSLA
jgi:L-aminopeptidase/D-esterase-like protein